MPAAPHASLQSTTAFPADLKFDVSPHPQYETQKHKRIVVAVFFLPAYSALPFSYLFCSMRRWQTSE